ncbi:hypothetical protein Nepgr_006842 [Nepenthes gracilis]|uniref:Protein kinase domain-containing protein n=1 Tax=Nepenthes gracilis TaxID=150966 RepID=A0AAD3S5S5_NEPGR|nr:hypothetical protein Nepgr_006842 [Nepenthes gracilis]
MKPQRSITQLTFLLALLAILSFSFADLNSDRQALRDFAAKFPHTRKLNWKDAASVCTSWVGVTCNPERSRVIGIRLPGVGLLGPLPAGMIGKLNALRVLSLRSNYLTGDLPSDVATIPTLQLLYLQQNNFTGSIPVSFSPRLTVLDLSFNSLNGNIPTTIQNLRRLSVLNLQNNKLYGPIPGVNLPRLRLLNLSNNNLIGSIPYSLQKFPSSSFLGNSLCGKPVGQCIVSVPSSSPSPSPPLVDSILPPSLPQKTSPRNKKFSTGALAAIIIGGAAVLFLLVVIILVCCLKIRDYEGQATHEGKASNTKKSQMLKEDFGSGVQEAEKNKLVFFEGCTYNFDLEDLLRASAEVLGKGSYGTAYKASLDEGTAVVVKRLKEVGIGKREFEQQMEVVRKIGQHPNVVPLRAYYHSKDEKLLVFDYVAGGSLASLLHGYRGNGRPPLDWNSRIRILLGTARGLHHIHSDGGGKFIHGNIKSSNVLLTQDLDGCISDFGLTMLMNFHALTSRTMGYHAPEVIESRKSTQRSDVYSFGVLLLEMLTGKAPLKSHGHSNVVDLPRWVQSVVREEWTSEVFDTELLRNPSAEEEMVQMLQIALACVARIPDMRPKMDEVVHMIEEIRQPEMEDQPSSEECKSKDSNACTP